jgi:hypothetical protein
MRAEQREIKVNNVHNFIVDFEKRQFDGDFLAVGGLTDGRKQRVGSALSNNKNNFETTGCSTLIQSLSHRTGTIPRRGPLTKSPAPNMEKDLPEPV